MSKIKKASTNFVNKNIMINECPEIYAINLIEGRWILIICCLLNQGKQRFSELKRKIPNITERMLTLQLRKMEENQLITRTVYPEVPPRVEYELTESGKKLKPIIKKLEEWGVQHREMISKKAF
ncbi:helix-turn-helix domain-containing protein [Apibacter sp.]|uniref:winged helix-turn-helix transcriptional regulator n=1 Tax=Apibacter sp. TaxID=2023709 RepID=UPI0025CC6AC3|nr:helix-turn-helix domain-containing protein [Apibacter sp.]MCT6868984.1 helix-turn-helix transcriptional regulator [Apibacter sp.]